MDKEELKKHLMGCWADPSKMDDIQLKGCINKFLYEPEKDQTDREMLTIVVLADKKKHFDFLRGYTRWKTIGSWREVDEFGRIIKEYPQEKNVQLEIEFKDRPDEKVGLKLMELFNEFNKRFVKEKLLYVRTSPIEESTL